MNDSRRLFVFPVRSHHIAVACPEPHHGIRVVMFSGGFSTEYSSSAVRSLSSGRRRPGVPYRIITAMFLHGGILHFALNMLVLYYLGDTSNDWSDLSLYGPFTSHRGFLRAYSSSCSAIRGRSRDRREWCALRDYRWLADADVSPFDLVFRSDHPFGSVN